MARLFSVNFNFQNQVHVALVSIREAGPDLCCQVRYTDGKLNSLFAGKQFVFNLLEGVKEPCEIKGAAAVALFENTVEAIKYHLDNS